MNCARMIEDRNTRKQKQKAREGNTDNGSVPDNEIRVNRYDNLVKENALFENYYKSLNIVPDIEWDDFLVALKNPLPVTFRVTGFRSHAIEMMRLIRERYFQPLEKAIIENVAIEKPKELVWYPGSFAWQLNLSRMQLRQIPELQKLKEFLYEQTEHGNISRQEAVSMIPPLVLGIEPHHKVIKRKYFNYTSTLFILLDYLQVLDMCAAPGSKTAQIIEFLHQDETNPIPNGFVIANDVDNKRCYTLVHQVKRLESPCFAIINHDASVLPNMRYPNGDGDTSTSNLLFDRILADVPCTGDGTLRKNPDLWAKWNPGHGFNMHGLQARIAARGAQLLAPGGLMVYSTCSMNPIENESVIANLLQSFDDELSLVDIRPKLPGLKTTPGLTKWKVIAKNNEIYESFEQVPLSLQTLIRPNMFPPANDILQKLNLDRCVRILPHHQDTGAFFIAVLHKREKNIEKPSQSNDVTSTVATNDIEEESITTTKKRIIDIRSSAMIEEYN
ncbi:unnamed protein product, partial [Didymodactylos carnosus]